MTPPDDVMTAAEAAALLDGWPHDPEGDPVGDTLARALRSVVALHERVASRDRHATFYMRQAFVFGVAETRRADAVALRGVLPDVWERLRDAPEPTWPDAPPGALQGAAAARDGGVAAPAGATGAVTGSDTPGQAWERGRLAGLDEAAGILRAEVQRLRAPHNGPQAEALARMSGANVLQRATGLIERAKALVSATKEDGR